MPRSEGPIPLHPQPLPGVIGVVRPGSVAVVHVGPGQGGPQNVGGLRA
jgi:hypothetical protein